MATSRKRNTQTDNIYNARRRYARAAVRNLEKAESASGATAARYRQLAKTNYDAAVALYGDKMPTRKSAEIRRLENEFGFDAERIGRANVERSIANSKRTLETNLNDAEIRREAEARALLSDSEIGSRILGGLVDVWRDKAKVVDAETGLERIDNKKIVPALLDYFGVGSLADVIEKLEETIGSKLYELKGGDENIYENIKIAIQTKVIEGTLVQ